MNTHLYIVLFSSLLLFSNCGMVNMGKSAIAKVVSSGSSIKKLFAFGYDYFTNLANIYLISKGLDLTKSIVDGYNMPKVIKIKELEVQIYKQRVECLFYLCIIVSLIVFGYIAKKWFEYRIICVQKETEKMRMKLKEM